MADDRLPLVKLTRVTRRYRERAVLLDTDLAIERGELVVIVGRSGSGKSTLLKLLGCLDSPTSGEITLVGRRIDAMSERERAEFRRRSIGFVFQFFNLIPTLTVRENVALPLALNNHDRSRTRSRVDSLLEELDVAPCADRFPEELSGGEQQRVAIARAIAHEPELVIADEPTGNLDLDTARSVIELLDRSCRRRGATLVMATHGREVIGVADRVLTIRNARIEESGT